MTVQWGLGGNGAQSALAMFQMGNQLGQQAKAAQRESETRNALATIFGEQTAGTPTGLPGAISGYGGGTFDINGHQVTPVQQPDNSGAWQTLLQNDPKMAMQLRHQQQTQQADQQKAKREQMLVMGKLLGHATDEASYQQSLAAARQYGMDVSSIPQNFDPNWVGQQRLIVDAFNKDGGESLTSNMKELVALGYKPGTPEFQQALAASINAGYARPYMGSSGETRLYTPQIAVPQAQGAPQAAQAPQQAQNVLTVDQYRGATSSLGAQEASGWLARNNMAVRVSTPDEARTLPSGTRILLPDGTEGRVP